MLQEVYGIYLIEALPRIVHGKRYGVCVRISTQGALPSRQVVYEENANVSFELQIEAEKECINFGKNLINAGFTTRKGPSSRL